MATTVLECYNISVKRLFAHFPKLKKRYWVVIILILLVGGWFFFGRSSQKVVIETGTVKRQDIKQTVSASGTLQGKDTANLHFGSSGILKYVKPKEGDNVSKNIALGGLDTQDLSITLQQAQNTLRDKQAILDKVLDDVKDHSSDETLAQKQARTTAEVSKDNAYDNVQDAKRALREATLTSPISGIVTKVGAIAGARIGSSDTIIQVVDKSSIYFDAEIDEADIDKIKLGQDAEVTLNSAGDKIFKGKVDKIIPVTTKTSSGSTIIIIRINLGSPEMTFVPGITGQASITTGEAKNVLSVSQDALVTKDEVYIQENGKVLSQKIETGFIGDTDIQVNSGLKEGELVIVNPAGVTPGTRNGGGIGAIVGRLFGVQRGGGAGGFRGGTR